MFEKIYIDIKKTTFLQWNEYQYNRKSFVYRSIKTITYQKVAKEDENYTFNIVINILFYFMQTPRKIIFSMA